MDTSRQSWIDRAEDFGRRISDGVAARDTADACSDDVFRALRAEGFTAMQVPSELGGGGASHRDTCRALQALARHDPSTALTLSMHQHLLSAQVFSWRSGGPSTLLERVANDGLLLVATGARDWLQSNGEARSVDGGYRVSAKKAFASGAPVGDLIVTSVPFDDPQDGPSVVHFALPLDAPGVTIDSDWKAHGMRATGSQTVTFEDVFVPEASVALKRPRDGFPPVWGVVLTVALPLICSVYVGVAQRSSALARPWARRRAEQPAVAWAVGQMDTALIRAETLLDGMVTLAADLDFAPSTERANRMLALKTSTVEAAQACVESAMQAAQGPAFFRKTGIERLLRDVRAGQYHPLAPAAQTLFTGRLGLGLSPTDA